MIRALDRIVHPKRLLRRLSYQSSIEDFSFSDAEDSAHFSLPSFTDVVAPSAYQIRNHDTHTVLDIRDLNQPNIEESYFGIMGD